MKLKIYTDGGARGNPGPAAVGVVIYDERGKVVFKFADTLGKQTNNVAEYCALITALEIAKKLHGKELECFSDSTLLVNQMSGNFKIKTEHIKTLYERAKRLCEHFDSVKFQHVPREDGGIRAADSLVNQALDGTFEVSQ